MLVIVVMMALGIRIAHWCDDDGVGITRTMITPITMRMPTMKLRMKVITRKAMATMIGICW